jgi:protease I
MKRIFIIVIVGIIIFGCSGKKSNAVATPPTVKDIKTLLQEPITKITDSTKVKRFVMVVAPRAFRIEEFVIPYDFLTSIGHKITVASLDTISATGVGSYQGHDTTMAIKPQLLVKDIDTLKYDGIILVGGMGAAIYWDNTELRTFVQYFARNPSKIVAAICLAPVTLARAGVLNGKKATVFEDRATIKELKNNGALYEKADVVISGNIITASGPAAAEKFAKLIALTAK